MLIRSRLLGALVAIAMITMPAPSQAQNSRIRVVVQNATPNCAWITFYRRDSSGIGGTLTAPQIIKDPRPQTGPLEIRPGATFEFSLPRVRWFRLRFESMRPGCNGNVGGDTDTTVEDAGNIDYYKFVLNGADRNLSIGRQR
jgi:hypothetical protein